MNWPIAACWLGTVFAGAIMSGIRQSRKDFRGAAVYGIIVSSLNVIMDLAWGVWQIAPVNGATLVFWLWIWWRNRRDKRRAKALIGAKTAAVKARMAQEIADRTIPVPDLPERKNI